MCGAFVTALQPAWNSSSAVYLMGGPWRVSLPACRIQHHKQRCVCAIAPYVRLLRAHTERIAKCHEPIRLSFHDVLCWHCLHAAPSTQARVHPRLHTPLGATLLVGAVTALLAAFAPLDLLVRAWGAVATMLC